MMKPRELPLSSSSQEMPVAIVLWCGGNQAELTTEGMVTTKGPILPLITPQVWARILKIKPESWWSKNSHCRQRIAAAKKIIAEQMRAPTLTGKNSAHIYRVLTTEKNLHTWGHELVWARWRELRRQGTWSLPSYPGDQCQCRPSWDRRSTWTDGIILKIYLRNLSFMTKIWKIFDKG